MSRCLGSDHHLLLVVIFDEAALIERRFIVEMIELLITPRLIPILLRIASILLTLLVLIMVRYPLMLPVLIILSILTPHEFTIRLRPVKCIHHRVMRIPCGRVSVRIVVERQWVGRVERVEWVRIRGVVVVLLGRLEGGQFVG